MAAGVSHDCNWEASGCAIRSNFVCFSYDLKAETNIALKGEEPTAIEGVCDMVRVATGGIDAIYGALCRAEGGNKESERWAYAGVNRLMTNTARDERLRLGALST
jgi:hypothetical protein